MSVQGHGAWALVVPGESEEAWLYEQISAPLEACGASCDDVVCRCDEEEHS